MKKYIYLAVAAITALSSCSSDNDPIMGETVKQPLKFTASMEDFAGTRATFDSEKKCASWEENDFIYINTEGYKAETAGLTTTFTRAFSTEAEGPTFDAYFGCEHDGDAYYIEQIIDETWSEGKFNMPMYAHSENGITDLKFKNLCGVLKVTVTNEQIDQVQSITVSSANKATGGFFTVVDNAAVLDEPNNTEVTRTVNYTSAVTTDAAGKVFYIPVPAQTYRELNIALSDGNGTVKNMTTKAGYDITVDRNKIYPITFNATSTQYDVTFNSFSIDEATATASNEDVTVTLTLNSSEDYMPGSWNVYRGALRFYMMEGTMGINVEPNNGVTVNGIVYTGSNNSTTKTGIGPWNFTVTSGAPWDGSLRLGAELNSVTVTYTK